MWPRGWGDVMASGAVAIGGGIAIKQMDVGAGDAFMLTGLGVTGLKAVQAVDENCKRKNHQETKTAILQEKPWRR